MTKFESELFMAEFLARLEEEFRRPARIGGFPFVSVSRIALQICREYRYAMWANRPQINRLIREWYRALPTGPSYAKCLFGHPVIPANAWSASFASVDEHRAHDFIHFLPESWGKD